MILLARALLAAYITESYDPPSVKITRILGSPFGKFFALISDTLELIAFPVAVPPPL
jgi:hypothetical protein